MKGVPCRNLMNDFQKYNEAVNFYADLERRYDTIHIRVTNNDSSTQAVSLLGGNRQTTLPNNIFRQSSTIIAGVFPMGAVYNPITGYVYILNTDVSASSVSVIDSANTVIATI